MKTRYILRSMVAGVVALGAMLGFNSCSDDDDIPFHTSKLHSFGPSPAERGTDITILGEGLDGVKEVVFPVDVHVSSFTSRSSDKILVTVPQEAVPGQIKLVMSNGEIITSRSMISFVEEIEIESVAPTTVNVGDIVTVKGEYLYNIASITFDNGHEISTESFTVQTRNELSFRVPAEAASGAITFSNGYDWEETWETPLTVTAPVVTPAGQTACDFGDVITVDGSDLDQIETIVFPGRAEAYFTVNADGTQVSVTVPLDTRSGAVTATLKNGAVIELLDIVLPEIAYMSVTPSTNITAGTKLTITGSLLDRVKEIRFPGGASLTYGKWEVSEDGTEIKVAAPSGLVDGKLTLVQNENIMAETDAISTLKMGNVFWTGNIDFGNWAGFLQVAEECADDVWQVFSSTIKGTGTLTFHFTEDESSTWWQFSPVYRSDWETTFEKSGFTDLAAGANTIQVLVTEQDLEMMHGAGWAFKGCFITLTAAEWEPDSTGDDPAPVTVWSGSLELDGSWGNKEEIAASAFSALKSGDSLVFTYAPTGTGDAQIKPMDGSWNPLSEALAANEWACIGLDDSGSYTMPLTDGDIDVLQSSGMILSGQHVTVTSIAIK